MTHTINRSGWSPDERAEYEELLGEIVAETTNTSRRLDLFSAKLTDALNAHRPWAFQVERACLRDGMAGEIKRHQDRNRAMVSYDGRVLNVPKIQGVKRRTAAGDVVDQRELIELCPWEEIAEKRQDALKARRIYDDKIAHYDRLLALREMAPESASPTDAAERLGIDIDDWLAVEGGAA